MWGSIPFRNHSREDDIRRQQSQRCPRVKVRGDSVSVDSEADERKDARYKKVSEVFVIKPKNSGDASLDTIRITSTSYTRCLSEQFTFN